MVTQILIPPNSGELKMKQDSIVLLCSPSFVTACPDVSGRG